MELAGFLCNKLHLHDGIVHEDVVMWRLHYNHREVNLTVEFAFRQTALRLHID